MDYYGYAGNILYVNLSSSEIKKEPLELKVGKDFIGGFGINNKIAYDIMKPGAKPFSEENPIIIGAGPLIGTFAPGACRVAATTKFPLTGAIATASGGMTFAPQLKWAGYDHIVITGKAKHPVYLRIFDDGVDICGADHLWGRDLEEATDELKREYGRCGVICIGQGGENLVSFALSFVDKLATLGRGGFGAVMGSKNLKAIVAKGTKGIKVAEPRRFRKEVESLYERARRYPLYKDCVDLGIMQNWDNYLKQIFFQKNMTQLYPPEKATELFGPQIYYKVKKERIACPSCFIGDKDVLEVKEGKHKGLIVHTPSFLNAAMLAARLGIENYAEALKLTNLLDKYGLCMFTFMGLIDFIFSLQEYGIITEKDTDGLPLKRDMDSFITWIEKITFRQGFGNIVAKGWQETIREIAKDAEKYPPIIKGKDNYFDPRASGLGTMEFEPIICPGGPTAATSGSPAYIPGRGLDTFRRHCERMGVPEEAVDRILDSPFGFDSGRLSRYSEDWYSLFTSMGICNRHMNNRFYHINIFAELYSAATGMELSPQEIMKAAERGWNLFKALNIREGFTKEDDKIPEQWFQPMKAPDGSELHLMDFYKTKVLTREDVSKLLINYYDERGWDTEKGIPTKQKLIDLGLDNIAEGVSKLGL